MCFLRGMVRRSFAISLGHDHSIPNCSPCPWSNVSVSNRYAMLREVRHVAANGHEALLDNP
jgi:hypothetical protein